MEHHNIEVGKLQSKHLTAAVLSVRIHPAKKIKLHICNIMTRTSKFILELLLAALMLTVVPVSPMEGSETCSRWRGQFRNCLCGKLRRDSEKHCHDDKTYYERILSQDDRECPFKCENGGTFDEAINKCNCPDGFFGLCCQKGEYLIWYTV